jgi:hypothetical protein
MHYIVTCRVFARDVQYLIKSTRTPTRNCNPNFLVTHFPVVDINTGWAHPFAFMTARTLPARISARCLNVSSGMAAHSSCRAVSRVMWGVLVWSEVGVLINPTGVLWDSGQDSGLSTYNQGAGCTIHSTAELLGHCFTRCLASVTNHLQLSTAPVGH